MLYVTLCGVATNVVGDITYLEQISRMFEEGSGDRRCRDLSVVSHPWSTTPTTSVDHCQGIAMQSNHPYHIKGYLSH